MKLRLCAAMSSSRVSSSLRQSDATMMLRALTSPAGWSGSSRVLARKSGCCVAPRMSGGCSRSPGGLVYQLIPPLTLARMLPPTSTQVGIVMTCEMPVSASALWVAEDRLRPESSPSSAATAFSHG